MEYKMRNVGDLIPYDNNPRLNEFAVEPVAESIRQCGYISPIIIDEDDVVLAGHTRLQAIKSLGFTEVGCIVVPGLTDEQKRKFRILDNKTSEIAEWDEDLLRGELEGLDLGDVHWFDNLINPNIESMVQETKSADKKDKEKEDDGIIVCPRCGAVVEAENLPFLDDSEEDEITWSNEEDEA